MRKCIVVFTAVLGLFLMASTASADVSPYYSGWIKETVKYDSPTAKEDRYFYAHFDGSEFGQAEGYRYIWGQTQNGCGGTGETYISGSGPVGVYVEHGSFYEGYNYTLGTGFINETGTSKSISECGVYENPYEESANIGNAPSYTAAGYSPDEQLLTLSSNGPKFSEWFVNGAVVTDEWNLTRLPDGNHDGTPDEEGGGTEGEGTGELPPIPPELPPEPHPEEPEPTPPNPGGKCGAGKATDHLVTFADGVAAQQVPAAPDPDFGLFSLRVRWCTGTKGAVIIGRPDAFASLSTNWLYLGLVEELGFTPVEPDGTKVKVEGNRATASTHFDLRFSPVEVAINILPMDKIFASITKALQEYRAALKIGDRPATALANYKTLVLYILDKKVGEKIEKFVEHALVKVPGISNHRAGEIGDGVDDVLEHLAPWYAEQLLELEEENAAKTLFKEIFFKLDLPMWNPKVTVTVHNNGTATYAHHFSWKSVSPFLLTEDWNLRTVT